MNQKKYLLFNPILGTYAPFENLEQLRIAREELLQIELKKMRQRYSVLEEVIYPNGDSETRPYKETQTREVPLVATHDIPILPKRHWLYKKVETI